MILIHDTHGVQWEIAIRLYEYYIIIIIISYIFVLRNENKTNK